MTDVGSNVGVSGFVIEARPYTDPDVTRLVAQVQAEYVAMYGGPDAAAVGPDEFTPPSGLLLVGLLDDVVVATGGWRRLANGLDSGFDSKRAELKRMYVVPAARRRGLSRVLLDAIERSAAAAGIRELVLNTGPRQHAAIALYLDSGYDVTAAFGHYATMGEALFYRKSLSAPSAPSAAIRSD